MFLAGLGSYFLLQSFDLFFDLCESASLLTSEHNLLHVDSGLSELGESQVRNGIRQMEVEP